eukprot:1137688-Pelagomonas_calceolata.AAC.3
MPSSKRHKRKPEVAGQGISGAPGVQEWQLFFIAVLILGTHWVGKQVIDVFLILVQPMPLWFAMLVCLTLVYNVLGFSTGYAQPAVCPTALEQSPFFGPNSVSHLQGKLGGSNKHVSGHAVTQHGEGVTSVTL